MSTLRWLPPARACGRRSNSPKLLSCGSCGCRQSCTDDQQIVFGLLSASARSVKLKPGAALLQHMLLRWKKNTHSCSTQQELIQRLFHSVAALSSVAILAARPPGSAASGSLKLHKREVRKQGGNNKSTWKWQPPAHHPTIKRGLAFWKSDWVYLAGLVRATQIGWGSATLLCKTSTV